MVKAKLHILHLCLESERLICQNVTLPNSYMNINTEHSTTKYQSRQVFFPYNLQGGSKTFELKTFEICEKMSKTFEIFEIHDFDPGAKTFEIFSLKFDIQKDSRFLQVEFSEK